MGLSALLVPLVLLGVGPAPSGAAPPAAAADGDTERARDAFRAGKAAAAEARWTDAIEAFERAAALRPAASIHYNIAVCHHNRMLATSDDDARQRDRAAAIDAYVRYLDGAPDAEDRAEVEAAIEQLGGRADQSEWVIERIEPDAAPAALALRDDDAPPPSSASSGDPTPTTPPPLAEPHAVGRVGPFFPLTIADPLELSRSDTMRLLPGIGLGVRGGAFVTRSHRLNVGGEFAMTGQPVSLRRDISLVTSTLGFVAEYAHPIGSDKIELGGGGMLGVAVQSLRYRGTTTVVCPLTSKALSTRGGLLAQARFVLAGVLGDRGQHELALRVSPGVGLFGAGSKGSSDVDNCDDAPAIFEDVGLRRRAALVVTIDLGYAPRF
jgi:tetratricopeptide (TPR) repeat protein